MKRLGAMLACLVMLGLSDLAFAQSTGMDGDFWVSQPRSGKSTYLDGFSDGMELGHYLSVWKNLEDAGKADAVNSAREAYSEYLYKFFGSVTGDQLLEGTGQVLSGRSESPDKTLRGGVACREPDRRNVQRG